MKIILLLLLNMAVIAHAEIYKCQVNDSVKYQKTPCQAGAAAEVLAIKQPPPDVLQRMHREEMNRDLIELKKKELDITTQKAAAELQIKAAEVDAYQRSIDARIQMHEDYERRQDARDEAWQNYHKCRDREHAGFLDHRNPCVMP